MPAHILTIDSDPKVQQWLALNLRQAGHRPLCALNAESALLMMEAALPALLLVEWDLPGQSGLSLVRRLRAQPRTRDLPVIMLTARAAEADKILALESGADDYITKPFSPRETLARMQAVLRRRQPRPDQGSDGTVQMAGLRLDPGTLRVTAGDRQLTLGRIEFRLLDFLMHHPERVYSRAQLLDLVWGSDACLDERTVDAHVGRLRSALQPGGYHGHVETVRGSGYRFTAWSAAQPGRQPDLQSERHAAPALPQMHLALLRLEAAGTKAEAGAGAGRRPCSRREMEILHWVREGKSNEEVGQILGISGLTVKNHLQRIYKTLGVSNRTQAVARGMALRLLDDGGSGAMPGKRAALDARHRPAHDGWIIHTDPPPCAT